jgi:transcription-repair coupling factor (superfamily II helicase)
MIDRFGLLPEPARNLFRVTELKLRAARLGVDRVEAGPGGGVLEFSEQPEVNPATIVRLVQQQPAVYRLEGQKKLRFRVETESAEARLEAVSRLIDTLNGQRAA